MIHCIDLKLRQKIKSLEANVEELKSDVATLQKTVKSMAKMIKALKKERILKLKNSQIVRVVLEMA